MSMNNGFFEVVVDGPLQDTIDQSYHSAPIIILAATSTMTNQAYYWLLFSLFCKYKRRMIVVQCQK
jgi:hypothetical protein